MEAYRLRPVAHIPSVTAENQCERNMEDMSVEARVNRHAAWRMKRASVRGLDPHRCWRLATVSIDGCRLCFQHAGEMALSALLGDVP